MNFKQYINIYLFLKTTKMHTLHINCFGCKWPMKKKYQKHLKTVLHLAITYTKRTHMMEFGIIKIIIKNKSIISKNNLDLIQLISPDENIPVENSEFPQHLENLEKWWKLFQSWKYHGILKFCKISWKNEKKPGKMRISVHSSQQVFSLQNVIFFRWYVHWK